MANESLAPTITRLSDFSQRGLSELKSWLEQVGLAIPINQLTGFSQFTAQEATIGTNESTASTSFVDLATVGPQLSNLPSGKYLFIFGAVCDTNAGAAIDNVGISFSGAAVAAGESSLVGVGFQIAPVVFVVLHTFTDGNAVNNYATLKYSTSTGTANFRNRWLVGLKYA